MEWGNAAIPVPRSPHVSLTGCDVVVTIAHLPTSRLGSDAGGQSAATAPPCSSAVRSVQCMRWGGFGGFADRPDWGRSMSRWADRSALRLCLQEQCRPIQRYQQRWQEAWTRARRAVGHETNVNEEGPDHDREPWSRRTTLYGGCRRIAGPDLSVVFNCVSLGPGVQLKDHRDRPERDQVRTGRDQL